MLEDCNVIMREWTSSKCPCAKDGHHWAYYVIPSEHIEYWRKERTDDRLMIYWRHYEFISIPCHACGAMSPLRSSVLWSNNATGEYDRLSCVEDQVVDYNPGDVISNIFDHCNIEGWSYTYFTDTMTDSRDPEQATFRLIPRKEN